MAASELLENLGIGTALRIRETDLHHDRCGGAKEDFVGPQAYPEFGLS
jgi:hypothetical protein